MDTVLALLLLLLTVHHRAYRLGDVTGITFDANSKTFTLKAIFDMQLFRFQESIEDIVNEAVQELKLENALRALEEKWKVTRFTVRK
jgi:hypothetical protein